MEKTCDNCIHSDALSCEEPCRSCCSCTESIFPNWEPIIHSYCKKCKHADKGPEEEPCQECGIDGNNYFEPKEEKKMAETRKTKAQLMEELEQKNNEIAELKKELKKSESYEQYVNCGKQIREMIDGFMEGGLSEDLAIKLVVTAAGEAAKWCIK